MSNPLSGNYPKPGTSMTDVVKVIVDELNEMKLFRDFVLQDQIMLEKYEQFKTFKILKTK